MNRFPAWSADPPGLMKLIDPLMGVMMRSHFHDLAKGIKRELDAGRPEPGGTAPPVEF